MTAWPESVDRLGRVSPAQTVERLLLDSQYWTASHVVQILQRINGPDSHAARVAIVGEAARRGITHGPPDLAGRRHRIVKD